MKLHLITAEGPETRWVRRGRLIRFPQLTMPLLAALTPPGVDITHTDEIVQKVHYDRSFDLVGITSTTCAAPHTYQIADEYRARGIPVVLGGPHPTLMPNEAFLHADSVVIGEAEGVWPQLIKDFREEKLRKFYRAARPPSLQGLPWARRDLIKGRWYGRGITIATRGCPHSCGYCMLRHYYHHDYRVRPVEEVVAEVASIKEKAIVFWDDNIIGDVSYSKRLFSALIPLRKWWTSQATIDVADNPELLRLAAQSGCKAFFIGLESINSESMKETHKGFNRPTQYLTAIKRLHEFGIAVQTGLVFGFDHDDVSVFERTLEFLEMAGIDVASIGSLTPFPGTPLFEKLERESRIITYDWSKYNARTDVVFRPRNMTPEQLQCGVEWLTRRFYSVGSITRRLCRSKVGLWWNIPRNMGYSIAFYKLARNDHNPNEFERFVSASRPVVLDFVERDANCERYDPANG